MQNEESGMNIDRRLKQIVEAQPYPLMFATISGAHLYGFPSPDSDFDLRGAHVLPLEKVIGLEVNDETVQSEMWVGPDGKTVDSPCSLGASSSRPSPPLRGGEGEHAAGCSGGGEGDGGRGGHVAADKNVRAPEMQRADAPQTDVIEMDIVSHDVMKKFFGLLLKKNGYVLEQLFSPLIVHTTPEHEELKAICLGKPSKSKLIVPGSLSATSPQPNDSFAPAHSALSGPPRLYSGFAFVAPQATSVSPFHGGEGDSTRVSSLKHHAHHYFGFAETQWNLFLKESPRRVKPLLYVYRVLLTGIHLMRTGVVEANVVTLNEDLKLSYIADLVARKLAGPENLAAGHILDSEIGFHESEYQRLRGELQAAHDASRLPETPSEETRAALNDLLVRTRKKFVS